VKKAKKKEKLTPAQPVLKKKAGHFLNSSCVEIASFDAFWTPSGSLLTITNSSVHKQKLVQRRARAAEAA
jgi:hypothetical protein